jgi:hypothetical protein
MSSKTYVICWDGSIENCLDIEKQMSISGLDYLIYNVSSKQVDSKNWLKAENVRYYGHFYNALKDFCSTNYSVFIFNAGDPSYDKLPFYTSKIEKIISNDKEIYALAPNIENDGFAGSASFIEDSSIYKNFNLATQTNGIYFAFSRELTIFMKNYLDWATSEEKVKFPDMHSGWGIDIVSCALSIYRNKMVYRDNSITMFHPNTTSTDQSQALGEMYTILDTFKEFCSLNNIDPIKIQAIYDVILKKFFSRLSYTPSIKEVYPNLQGEIIA